MNPFDASFLHIEDAVQHMHIGSMAVFEGAPPSHTEFTAMIADKLGLVPRYRHKVRMLPMSLGRPVWVDDPYFNIGYHVRRTALPAPGSDEELKALMGRVMSQKLDRSKPLWELWVVEGLDGDRWALINKLHHCMVDGVSGTDLVSTLFDDRTLGGDGSTEWHAEPEPTDTQLVAAALAGRSTNISEIGRTLLSAARGPRRAARQVEEFARAVGSLQGLLRPSASTLNGPIGPHRRWAWARAHLTDIKTIRREHGGTVNDVVLAAIARGFRDLLISRGEPVDDDVVVRTLVPVSVRTSGDTASYENKVSVMFADLPVGIEDPVKRLAAVRVQMEGLKESKQALAASTITSMSGFAPAMLLDLAGRVSTRAPQRSVNTVTTNVPGPQKPIFLLGRRMIEYLPFVPLGTRVRITVAIVSYDGNFAFGVTGDWETAPDIEILCKGIEHGITELLPRPARPSKKRVQT